jgi:hypothetical protein
MVKKHELTEYDKSLIHRALGDAGVKSPCGRCGCPDFTLLNGYVSNGVMPHFINEYYSKIIPAVVTICVKCGNMNQHSVEALRLPHPEIKPSVKLTEQEKKIVKRLGITEGEYLKNKNKEFFQEKHHDLMFEDIYDDHKKKPRSFYPETKSTSFLGKMFDKLGL